jgi:hypothetical protein
MDFAGTFNVIRGPTAEGRAHQDVVDAIAVDVAGRHCPSQLIARIGSVDGEGLLSGTRVSDVA